MTVNRLNSVQNFSDLQIKTDNTQKNPIKNKDQALDESKSPKQIVNAQKALAYYTIPQINTSFKGSIQNEEMSDMQFERLKKEYKTKVNTLSDRCRLHFEYKELNKNNINLALNIVNNPNLCDKFPMLAYLINEVKTKEQLALYNKIFTSEEVLKNDVIRKNAGEIIRLANNEEQIKLAHKIFSTKEFYTNEDILKNAGDIIRQADSDEHIKLINKIFSSDELYNNKDILMNAGNIIKAVQTDKQAELANKIFSSEEFYKNKDILKNAGKIISAVKTDEQAELANNIFSNKELYNNRCVLNFANGIIYSANTKEHIELANRVLSNKEFYNNKNIISWAGSIINCAATDGQLKLVNKIFSDKELYNNEGVITYANGLISSAESDGQLRLANKILSTKEIYSNSDIMYYAGDIINNAKTEEQLKLADKLLSFKECEPYHFPNFIYCARTELGLKFVNQILENEKIYKNDEILNRLSWYEEINNESVLKRFEESLKDLEEEKPDTYLEELKKTEEKEYEKDILAHIPVNFCKFFSYFYHNGLISPNGLQDLSNKLRYRGDENLSYVEEEILENVDKAFNALPSIEEEQILYRSINRFYYNDDYFDKTVRNAQIGDEIIPDRGYTQAGLSKHFSLNYLAEDRSYNEKYFFEMKFPKGSKICFTRHTGSGSEEGFLPRNAKFKVINIEKNCKLADEKSATKFTLEYVLPKENENISEGDLISEIEEVKQEENEFKNVEQSHYGNEITEVCDIGLNNNKIDSIEKQDNVNNISDLDKEIMEKISRLTENQKRKLNDFLASIL